MRALRLLITAVLASGLALVGAGAAHADERPPSVSWAFTPSGETDTDGRRIIEAEADPGEQLADHVAVRNLSDRPITFTISAHDGYINDDGHFAMLPRSEESVDAGLWLEVADEITVAPRELGILPVTITVPDDATPGDHLAGFAAAISSDGAQADGTELRVESRIGFPVLIRVTGELAPSLEAEVLSADYRTSWNPFQPGSIDVTYEIRNTGNVALAVSHEAAASGRTAPDSAGDAAEMVPGDERTHTVRITGVWPLGWSTVVVDAEGTREDLDAPTASAEYFVWTVPWPQLIVLAALGLLVFGILRGRRRRRRELDRMMAAAREEGARAAREQATAENAG